MTWYTGKAQYSATRPPGPNGARAKKTSRFVKKICLLKLCQEDLPSKTLSKITLLSGPFDHTTDFRDLFADSCGPIGDFTDIHTYQDGTFAISEEMKKYQFFLRNMEGQWLAKVQPFDPESFCVKVHANAVLLYAPFRSQLTLLQHLCLQLNLLPPSPRYWPVADRSDGSLVLAQAGRWRSCKTLAWLRKNGNDSIPASIRGEMLARLSGRWTYDDEVQLLAPPGLERLSVLTSFQ